MKYSDTAHEESNEGNFTQPSRQSCKNKEDQLITEQLALLDKKRKDLELARSLYEEGTELWTLLTKEISELDREDERSAAVKRRQQRAHLPSSFPEWPEMGEYPAARF